ncbi:hypothetical protein BDA96_03G445900 [Sorghum bicolor]|uniref:Uncharacterized protein n=2 Tax=Sorghum bicolor TaxID=4558 RepID=A0A921RIF2_SORBI|nr:hypothetical protein BDA96_03G445900 [Sorghum bicolor]OQU88158.1 hypothetical protein SORBI_3003G413550 [Sorghum bicolor]
MMMTEQLCGHRGRQRRAKAQSPNHRNKIKREKEIVRKLGADGDRNSGTGERDACIRRFRPSSSAVSRHQ